MRRRAHWIAGTAVAAAVIAAPALHAGLPEYVHNGAEGFTWRVEEKQESQAGTAWHLTLTSQVWQGIPWEHQLQVYEPAEVKYPDMMLLLISGGSNGRKPRPEDGLLGSGLAHLCGARCAVLPQVPNQPLLDGKKEDALIAETFVRYLQTGDENWPLLFPMVKSAVRAMDALQAWGEEQRKPVKQFVVTGASKRGWTTWLTASLDKRVAAIAPMVIDMLNIPVQIPNQLAVWGEFSEQIEDYTQRGLVQPENQTDEHAGLWRMVDPYSYRDRLVMPKLLILGTNDRYWTLNALNLYWDGLKGPKHVVYVPNAGHNLQPNVNYATGGVAALFRHVASGQPLPKVSWKHSDAEDGRLRLTVTSSPDPQSAKLWIARSASHDFREARWESSPMRQDGETWIGDVARPADGDVALFADLEYEIDGLAYHLSTQIRQAGLPRSEAAQAR